MVILVTYYYCSIAQRVMQNKFIGVLNEKSPELREPTRGNVQGVLHVLL